jgi:hypothetical protein
MVLIVCLDQCEGHGKVTQRIGGKQDRAATVMDFINTQHA